MKQRWPIFIGLFLLTLGIILRITTEFHPWSLIILLSGIALKVGYIINKIVRKEYQPGFEILLLFTGLLFFLGGIFLHKMEIIDDPGLLKTIGIILKVGFIVVFIRKSKT